MPTPPAPNPEPNYPNLQPQLDQANQTINDLQTKLAASAQSLNDLTNQVENLKQCINDQNALIQQKNEQIQSLQTQPESDISETLRTATIWQLLAAVIDKFF